MTDRRVTGSGTDIAESAESGRAVSTDQQPDVEPMAGDRFASGRAVSDERGPGDDRDTELAIETDGLVKHFGETKAVDGVDLAIPEGGIYGLLGPNGAGKTTVIRMLATLLSPDAGTARVFGHDVVADADAVRSRVSLTGQFASVDEDLTGRENLVLLARLLGYPRAQASARADELLEAFGLSEAATRQVSTYSGGMARRLDIAASIVVTPDLLCLDEPTTGLDPRNRTQVWAIIRALVANGTTVLLTTQYLEEADQLADRLAVIDEGRIVAEGAPNDLKSSVGSGVLTVRVGEPVQREEAANALTRILDVPVDRESDPTALSARVEETDRIAHAFVELSHAGVEVTAFALEQPTLDEVFLALTDRPASDGERADGFDADATAEAR